MSKHPIEINYCIVENLKDLFNKDLKTNSTLHLSSNLVTGGTLKSLISIEDELNIRKTLIILKSSTLSQQIMVNKKDIVEFFFQNYTIKARVHPTGNQNILLKNTNNNDTKCSNLEPSECIENPIIVFVKQKEGNKEFKKRKAVQVEYYDLNPKKLFRNKALTDLHVKFDGRLEDKNLIVEANIGNDGFIELGKFNMDYGNYVLKTSCRWNKDCFYVRLFLQ
ncbi:hypothetical protein ABK040_010991 [Willaertia magna]